MSWQTNPIIIRVRSYARDLGLTRIVGKILQRGSYEKAFDDAMFAAIGKDDVVWDVGANIGYYSKKFANASSPGGKVFAFEPFPETVVQLQSAVVGWGNISILPKALGAKSGTVRMAHGGDELGATNKIVSASTSECFTEVEVITGDALVGSGDVSAPNIMKIDTEGFELEVLEGMACLLRKPELRAIFIEVHFGNLAERGMSDAPAKIEKILSANGYRLRWLDPSHLAAYRG